MTGLGSAMAGNRVLLRHAESGAEDLTYYDYDAANELTRLHDVDGWTYFAYDANGNAIMEQTPSWTRYYDWDGRDMLVGVRSTEGGWTDNVSRYDGMASRVSTLESTGLTYYDWNGINVLEEKDSGGSVTDRQVHGYAPIPSVGDIALMDKEGTAYVPVSDQVGTVWNPTDSSAALANSYAYDAFGVGRSVSEAVANAYRFGTKRLDQNSELYHFIARQYAATIGRFVARAPVGRGCSLRQGCSYAAESPLSRLDVNGAWIIERSNLMGLANAESECYDTVEGLADDIGLNASEWDHWIRTPIRIRTLDPAKTIWFTELTQTTELDRGQGFLVPNAIYAHWGGVLRGDGRDCASCGFQGNLKAFAPELMAKIIEERTEDPQATFKAAFQKVDNKYRKYFVFKSGIMEPIRDVFPMQ